jgi:arylsulfatase
MPPPNILLITTDQHNAEILGCAGNPVVKTPNIDRLAAEGVMFDSAFTPHPICTPARTSIFTGQYARTHGVPYNINIQPDTPPPPEHTGLAAEATAFPEVLAANGYDTSFFGKLHTKQAGEKNFGLQHMKLAEGKGQFVDYGAPPDDYREYLKANGHPESAWRTWELPGYAENGHVTCPLPEEDYIEAWTATVAIEHLRQVAGPFFSWVSFSGPHTPWDPPEPYDAMYNPADVPFPARREGELEEKHPQWVERLAKTIPAVPWTSGDHNAEGGIERAYARFPDDQVRGMLAAYYGQVTMIDAQVGRLLAWLDESGQRENTLILFTADHGDQLGNNWAFFKYGTPYDSLARIPMIASWPGHTSAGSHCDELVSLVDIAPTFLEAAGQETVDTPDGRSLAPLLHSEDVDWREDLVVESGVPGLMTREWRYIRWRDGFEELYSRRDDPHDLYNLASRPEHASTCRELAERLSEW